MYVQNSSVGYHYTRSYFSHSHFPASSPCAPSFISALSNLHRNSLVQLLQRVQICIHFVLICSLSVILLFLSTFISVAFTTFIRTCPKRPPFKYFIASSQIYLQSAPLMIPFRQFSFFFVPVRCSFSFSVSDSPTVCHTCYVDSFTNVYQSGLVYVHSPHHHHHTHMHKNLHHIIFKHCSSLVHYFLLHILHYSPQVFGESLLRRQN